MSLHTCDIHVVVLGHVETVVLVSDKRVDGYIDIDLDVKKFGSKGGRVTYAEIKDYVKEKVWI